MRRLGSRPFNKSNSAMARWNRSEFSIPQDNRQRPILTRQKHGEGKRPRARGKGEGLTTKSAKDAKAGRKAQRHKGTKAQRGGRRRWGANQELLLTTLRLIRLRRNRIASRRGNSFVNYPVGEQLHPVAGLSRRSLGRRRKASSVALFFIKSVLIRVIRG